MTKRIGKIIFILTFLGIQLAIVSIFLSRSCKYHTGEQNRRELLKYAMDYKKQIRHRAKEVCYITKSNTKMLRGNINIVGTDLLTMQENARYAKNTNYRTYSHLNNDRALDKVSIEKSAKMYDIKSFLCKIDEKQQMNPEHSACILNVFKIAETVDDNECVYLNFKNPTPVCIHDPRFDRIISSYVFLTGMWEKNFVKVFIETLNKVEDIVVLDIGCNIGVYTLVAAKNGYRVVAIDANLENLRLLSKSVVLGDLTEKVTLIWNAVSDKYTNVTLQPTDKNIGGYFINTTKETISETELPVQTILLDDIQYFFLDTPVAIKIDIEFYEIQALRGGLSFLENIKVKFIVLEMKFHRTKTTGREIVQLLDNFGFKPYRACTETLKLELASIKQWPVNVCFMK